MKQKAESIGTLSYNGKTGMLLLLLFLTFSVLVANPKKLLYTVANPARGLLNREKRTKEKVWQHVIHWKKCYELDQIAGCLA